jgi:hypothetical protein
MGLAGSSKISLFLFFDLIPKPFIAYMNCSQSQHVHRGISAARVPTGVAGARGYNDGIAASKSKDDAGGGLAV